MPVQFLLVVGIGANRKPPPRPLGAGQNIRGDAVLTGGRRTAPAGAADAGLHLIKNQQRAILHPASHARFNTRGWPANATFARTGRPQSHKCARSTARKAAIVIGHMVDCLRRGPKPSLYWLAANADGE